MNIVTIGGVTVGLAILVHHVVTWWPGLKRLRKDPAGQVAALAPFLLAWSYGALAILTVGGIIGWIADTTLWISSWLGDVALVWGVGGTTGTAAGRTTYLPLTQTGTAVVLLLTVLLLAAAKKSQYGGALKSGAWCGICLGTSAGVTGLAAVPLAQAVNWLGANAYGIFA
ncbi:hypothetical protein ACFWHG_05770 [Streptomyces microflavus]|uniref:hypothetical protein n=1 Tax=Streptomyces microflavus TaxID=1919 RepID=UPI00364ADD81